jgi:hypothetical protein
VIVLASVLPSARTDVRGEIDPRSVRRALLTGVAALTAASLVAQVLRYEFDRETAFGFVPIFDANLEGNLPTWLSSLGLLLCSLLLGVIAAAERQASRGSSRKWTVLAAVFPIAAVDEAAGLHEHAGANLSRALGTDILFPMWVVPGAVLLVLLAIHLRSLPAQLPAAVRSPALWGVGLFFGSALLMELVEARIAAVHDSGTLGPGIAGSMQETGEMLGVVLVLEALLRYLAYRGISVSAGVRAPAGDRP